MIVIKINKVSTCPAS